MEKESTPALSLCAQPHVERQLLSLKWYFSSHAETTHVNCCHQATALFIAFIIDIVQSLYMALCTVA